MSIRVESITMEGFFRHSKSLLKLPDKGIVVVTGPNGAGKSSLPEAVSVALWGKTLRGTPPWPEKGGRVRVLAIGRDPVAAERSRKGTRTTLEWGVNGKSVDFENTTKAQAALEQVVGSWDVWRRAAIFSSQDAAHFTMATDKERKLLLETILGLDRFDDALKACREDLKIAEHQVYQSEHEEESWGHRLDERKQRLKELRELVERDVLPPEPVKPQPIDFAGRRSEIAALQGMIDAAEVDLKKLGSRHEQAVKDSADLRAKHLDAQRAADRLADDDCPTCGQPISKQLRGKLQAAVDKTRQDYQRAATAEVQADKQYRDERSEFEEELADLRSKRETKVKAFSRDESAARAAEQAYKGARMLYEAAQKRVAKANEQIEKAASEVTQAADEKCKASEAREAAERELALLSAVERVLGLKGVRANVLGRALSGLTAVANSWLSKIAGGGLELELKSYSEKVTGGVTDAISLEVTGAGGGYGYRGASGGERRRIDVALLFALAEVAQVSAGSAPDSTLWFDEVFDALDGEGVEAVASALHDLAQNRAVVVLTHSVALAAQLSAVKRLRVEAGKLQAM